MPHERTHITTIADTARPTETRPCPPPFLRIVVLISAAVLLLGLAFVASSAPSTRAQTVTNDYDTDDDGLIEVANANQYRSIADDLDGDGVVSSASAFWNTTGYPSASTAAGCPARDHDGLSTTPDQPSCLGYELVADIYPPSGTWIGGSYTAKLLGNGFRIINPTPPNVAQDSAVLHTLTYDGVIEGLGVVNPRLTSASGGGLGGIMRRLEGKLIGSYVEGGRVNGGSVGGIAREITTHNSNGAGLIAHSYVRGTVIGNSGEDNHGGLFNDWEHKRGNNQATCVNSYASVVIHEGYNSAGLLGSNHQTQGGGSIFRNCVADGTTDGAPVFAQNNVPSLEWTKARMVAPTSYDTPATNNPFANWDDYAADGTALVPKEPRTDFWFFGDSTTFPVLKGFGHDRTIAMARTTNTATSVNLCTRTLAVANEIIRHLQDNIRVSGVTTTPQAVTDLTPCTSNDDTKEVTIKQLADLVVTTDSHRFNLNPDRTFPESERLYTLDINDFAYLTSAAHFDLSGNSIETLPPRLFQGVPLRWLDLSNNQLTTLPADLFEGLGTVTETSGNALLLSDNTLTDTGMVGRLFDKLPHINALDLSNNAITRVNLRWFDKLNNLGRKAATSPPYTHALGLHLAGNTITEHYRAEKLFTGVRSDIVTYADVTTPLPVSAGNGLRTAIIAAITAANTSVANLDLATDEYYPASGYTSTACTAGQTVGPGRYLYRDDATPDCYIQPHWSAPHKSTDTATTAPNITSATASSGEITLRWTHTSDPTFIAYQLRYRHGTTDPWTPWHVIPITANTATKLTTIDAAWYNQAYEIEMRALSTTGPPSTVVTRTVTNAAASWLSGFTAAMGSSDVGSVALGWTAISTSTLPNSAHTIAAYYYRYKLHSHAAYSAWTKVPDGAGDADTDAGNETAYTVTRLDAGFTYDFQLVGGIDSDGDDEPDYFSERESASSAPLSVPAGLSAAGGTTPATIQLMWMMQTVSTSATTKIQVRAKRKTAKWGGVEWIDVPDSTGTGGDADTDAHNETAYTLTGVVGGILYDIQVRLFRSVADGGPLPPTTTSAAATAVPSLAGLSATTGDPGAFTLNWTARGGTTVSTAHYEIRFRYTGDDWPLTASEGWFRIPSSTHATNSFTVSGLLNNRSINVELRYFHSTAFGYSLPSAIFATTGSVTAPASLMATASRGAIALGWTAQSAGTSSEAKYQLRYKRASESWPTTDDLGWADIAGSGATTSSHSVSPLEGGTSYNFELRFHWSNAIGASAATAVTATPGSVNPPTGFSATAGTAPGEIGLTWTAQSDTTSTTAKYQFRHRIVGEAWPTDATRGWADIPSSTHSTTSYTLFVANGQNNEVQIRFHWTGFSTPVSDTATTVAVNPIAGFSATGLVAEIELDWTQQTATTHADANYEVRFKGTNQLWPPITGGWMTITGSSHSTDTHTIVDLDGGAEYDVEVRFRWNDQVGATVAATAVVTTVAVPAMDNFRAIKSELFSHIDLAWNAQTVTTSANARFQYRIARTPIQIEDRYPWGDWTDVDDGDDTGTHKYDEEAVSVAIEFAGQDHTVEMRFIVGTTVGPTTRSPNIRSGQLPIGLTGTTGDAPGTIVLTWDPQTTHTSTHNLYRLQYRRTDFIENFGSWVFVNDSADAGLHTYDETTFTLTGLVKNTDYYVRMTFRYSSDGWISHTSHRSGYPRVTRVRAGIVQAPRNFAAVTAADGISSIDLTWDQQTTSTLAASKYQYRVKLTSDPWPTTGDMGWTDIGDGSDSGNNVYDESSLRIGSLTAGSEYNVELRFHWNTTYGNSATVSGTAMASAIPEPPNFTATTGAATGTVDMAWELIDGAANYQYRYKLNSAPSYGAWNPVADQDGDSAVNDEDAITVTGLTANSLYDFQVRARTATADGANASDSATAQTQPAPTSAMFSAGTNAGEIDISWAAPATGSPDGFQVRYKLESDSNYPGTWTNVPDSGTDGRSNETSHTITGLRGGSAYDVQLRAEFTAGDSLPTSGTTGQVTATPLAGPTGLTAVSGDLEGELELAWTAITTTLPTGHSVLRYQYSYKLNTQAESMFSDWADMPPANTSSFSLTGLTAATRYDVRIRAAVDDGSDSVPDYFSAISMVSAISPTPMPTGLAATAGTNPGEVNLTWTAQTAYGASYTTAKYQIRTKLTSQSAWPATSPYGWADISGSSHTTASHALTGLTNGQQRDIQLRFLPNSTHTSATASVQATPTAVAAPTTLAGSADYNAVALTWDAQSATTNAQAKYQLRYKKTSDSWPATAPNGWADVASSSHSTAAHTVTGLEGGNAYEFQLRFHYNDAVGASVASSVSGTPTAIPAPTGVTATPSATPRQLTISWDAQTAITNSDAKWQTRLTPKDPTATPGNWTDVADGDGDGDQHDESTATRTGLTPYRPYDVEVRLVVGTAEGYVTKLENIRAGYQPRNFTATAGDVPGTVVLKWDQQTAYTGAQARFSTREKKSSDADWTGGTWVNVGAAGNHSATTQTRTGLDKGVAYDFQIRFRDASNWAAIGYLPTVTNVEAAIVLPPENFGVATATAAAGAVAMTWDPQTESTTADSKFQYRSKLTAGSTWSSWTDVTDGDDTNTHTYDEQSFNATGLTAGMSYDFELRFHWNATHGESTSVAAGPATASSIPAPPNFDAASGTAPGSIDLSWDLVEGASEYQYRYRLTDPPSSTWGNWTQVADQNSDSDVSDEDEITITTGLTAGTSYTFELRAHVSTSFGPSSSDAATAQTQSPPRNAMFSQGSNAGEIDVQWDAPSSGTPTGYGYRYKLASESNYPTSGAGAWTQVPDVNSNSDRTDDRSFTISSLWSGVSYNIQIRVLASVGNSEPGMDTTGTVTATAVAAPASFTATIGDNPGEIDLAWTQIPTSALPTSDTVVQYQYRTKLTSVSSWGDWTNMPTANTASYTITGLSSYTAYDVDIRGAIDDNDDADSLADYHSSAASTTNTRSGLAIPASLNATAGTDPGEIDLTWTAQTAFGATFSSARYQVRTKLTTASWPTTGDLGWTSISGSSRTTATHTLTALMAGQLHDIQLRFQPNGDNTLTSAAASTQGTPTAVPTPSGFGAATSTGASGAIELTWTAQTASTDTNAKYQYRSKLAAAAWPGTSPFGWTDIADSTADADSFAYNESALRLTGLSSGQSYNIELRFHWSDAVGPSAATSQTASASAIPAPATFTASTGSGPGEVDLTWAAVAAATYEYRTKLSSAADSTYTSWTDVGSVTTYTVTGLTNAANYTIQIRALVSGVTGTSPVLTATAQAQQQPGPQNFTTAQGSNPGEISLSWAAPTSGTVTRYEYRYKLASDASYPASGTGAWANIPDSDNDNDFSDETSHLMTSLLGGLSYNIQLRVLTGAGYSLPTTSTRTATPVAAPANFAAAIGPNPGTIALTWTTIATTAVPSTDTVVQYQYRAKLITAPTYPNWVNIPPANTSSYDISGLASNTEYDVQLRAAIDDGGDADSVADYHSNYAIQFSVRSGLATPTGLRATPSTTAPGSIVINWTQQSTFTAATVRYDVRHKLTTASWPSGGGWTRIATSTHSTTTHTITNIMSGRQHNIEVRLYVDATLGASAGASVVGTASSLAVPTGLNATTSTSTSGAIDIRWTGQSAITVSTATFQYRAKQTSASWPGSAPFGWMSIPDGSDADSDAHNEIAYTITNLTADASYNIELRLYMSPAVGASNAATAIATASRVPVPTGFNASTGSDAGEIDLSWTAVMGADDYQFRCSPAGTGCDTTWKSAGTGTSHTITGLTAREFYNVQLRARVTGIGESAPTSSQRAQAQTTPGPATLTFSHGPAPGDIKLDWTAPAMNAPVEHYEYRYKLESASDSAYSAWAEVMDSTDAGTSQADETTITISDLQAGVSYHIQFRVFASQAIQYSLPQRGTQAARPVPPPTAFTATGGTNPGEVTLEWNAPAGVTILRYELRHRLGTTGDWSSWVSAATATTYTYTGLLAGTSRTFNLRAVMQTVGASAPVSVAGTPTPVPTPTGFMASTGTFPGEIDLTWGAVTGATSYQYRYGLTATPPATSVEWSDWTTAEPALSLTATLTLLDEGESYDAEVRALITNVGMSTAASKTAMSRGPTFADAPGTPAPPADPESGDSLYEISATALPGRITIKIPASSDPFIYRHRTTNPGEWSRWFKVTPDAMLREFRIPDLNQGVEYDIEVRVYTVATSTFTTALEEMELLVLPLEPAREFEASETSGVILLQWKSPEQYSPDDYQYRTRPTGTAEWGEWMTVQHAGGLNTIQRHYVTGLEPGISHDFQLIMRTSGVATPEADSSATARLRIAEAHSIKPVVREVSIRAGETIALTVDIYDTQQVIDNSIPAMPNSKLIFRWTELEGSGGSFGTPNDERRVTYTAPSSPGRYTIQAEAQPDGVCTSHHEGEAEISTSERAQCQAIFTIRVTAAPTVAPPRPDPVNPTGSIPTSMTDNQGVSYAVVTPADGGTFTGQDITVTAPEGAVPDRTILGITAAASDITPPAPIPGATLSVAGSFYEINALQESGDPPLQSYTLSAPATACLPFPDEFRATLSNVVLIQRTPDGNLSPLSTKIRTAAGTLSVCGTLSQLPATVAVARLGLVPAATVPTPAPEQPLPDTGAPAPSATLAVLILLAGMLLFTAMRRIRQDR